MLSSVIVKVAGMEKEDSVPARITSEKAAYMAGILDGEGSLCLIRRNTLRGKNNPTYSKTYEIQITVVSSTLPLLTWIHDNFGGQILRIDNKHNHIWRWKVMRDEIASFLTVVSPFLVIKRNQSDLLLQFFRECRWIGNGQNPIPILLQEKREEIYLALRSLHTRNGRPAKEFHHAC